jgi:hypothetical protein
MPLHLQVDYLLVHLEDIQWFGLYLALISLFILDCLNEIME